MPRGENVKGPGNRNENKFQSYRYAWGDIKKAIGSGFYSEAINREETMISDRLLSYLCRVKVLNPDDEQNRKYDRSLNDLIQQWKKATDHKNKPISDDFFDDLQTATDTWRQNRNKIHKMAKSLPGQAHQDPLEFKEQEKIAAQEGERLLISIQNWYDRVKYHIRHKGAKDHSWSAICQASGCVRPKAENEILVRKK